MSSYLNIYLLPKEQDKKLLVANICRSDMIYDYFNENGITYAHDDNSFTLLTKDLMDSIVSDVYSDYKKSSKRIDELEKHAAGNAEIIEEIISSKEYRDELYDAYMRINSIRNIVVDLEEFDFFDFEGVYANIG